MALRCCRLGRLTCAAGSGLLLLYRCSSHCPREATPRYKHAILLASRPSDGLRSGARALGGFQQQGFQHQEHSVEGHLRACCRTTTQLTVTSPPERGETDPTPQKSQAQEEKRGDTQMGPEWGQGRVSNLRAALRGP